MRPDVNPSLQMMLANHTSRYHIAATAMRSAATHNSKVQVRSHELATLFMHMAQKDRDCIYEFGKGASKRNGSGH